MEKVDDPHHFLLTGGFELWFCSALFTINFGGFHAKRVFRSSLLIFGWFFRFRFSRKACFL